MPPVFRNSTVSAKCPGCNGALAAYEHKSDTGHQAYVIRNEPNEYEGRQFSRVVYYFMKCGGCGRAGIAEIRDNGTTELGVLADFYPVSIERLTLPKDVPLDIKTEFEEAELCAAHKAYRAASALMRSVLEKTLKVNGYITGTLFEKIEEAFKDGVITETRRKRVHENIRILGNDVVHDDWREITSHEFEDSHGYAQRLLEDFYDHRPTVEGTLKAKGRCLS